MNTLQQVTLVTNTLLSMALLVLTVVVLVVLWRLRSIDRGLRAAAARASNELLPLLTKTSAVLSDIQHLTNAARGSAAEVSATVQTAAERVNRVAAAAEARVHELNALLEVVQGEAEDLFVSTASTVRGLRSGAGALRRDGTDLASDELADFDVEIDERENDNGNDDNGSETQPAAGHAPRVRPRSRPRA